MKKIIIIGSPGAGKSTFARRLKEKTGLPLFYLDMIYHKADRTTVSRKDFDKALFDILSYDEWIIDGNYGRTMELRFDRCDAVFFLDFPAELCLRSAKERVGQVREDLPWVEIELDDEFAQWIKDFPNREIPKINDLINKYKDKINIFVFKSREDIEEFFERF